MTREIRELEAIVADMKAACERWQNERAVALRAQEIPAASTGQLRFNKDGTAYWA